MCITNNALYSEADQFNFPRISDDGSIRPSVPFFDLQRPPYTSKVSFEELPQSSVQFEGFDEVISPKYKHLFTECIGKKLFTFIDAFEDTLFQ